MIYLFQTIFTLQSVVYIMNCHIGINIIYDMPKAVTEKYITFGLILLRIYWRIVVKVTETVMLIMFGFIFLSIWWEIRSHKVCVSDYAAFAEVLTQAPLRTRNFKLKIRLSEEDLRHMAEFAKHRFDVIMGVLRAMPRSLILVIR